MEADGTVGVTFDVMLEIMSCRSCVSVLDLGGGGGGWLVGIEGRCHCVVPDEL